ncbi:MAG: lysophospholipid acyltransferase family protein [Deferrisomatales bacterium]|nr:lysophospholipid acyltransferase family protein [Deferrisomatales bacterium]
MEATAGPAPTLAHRLQHAGLRLLEESVSRLRWEQRLRVGRLLGGIWHAVDAPHRKVARENAGRAFPDWGASDVSALVRRNFAHLGETAAESVGLARTDREELLARCRFEGLEHLEAALGQGRGALVLTAHLGNWELAGLAMSARGYPFFAVGRRQANPLIDRRVTRLRESFGGRLIHHREAVRPVLRALRVGGVVAFLMDQRASSREGVRSRFFGRPVATNQGLALLALKTGAPVVPGFGERVGARHVIRVGTPVPPPTGGSREEQVRRYTEAFDAAIEAAVLRRPEQWFWVHRRWRLPRNWEP